MNNDSDLATGMGSPETFGNENLDDETQQAVEAERAEIAKMLPTAQKEIDRLNAEITAANSLTDFADSLGVMPTDLPEDQLRVKLEARFAYINLLVNRKLEILDGLDHVEGAGGIKDEPVVLPPIDSPLVVRVHEEVTVPGPRPTGWKAIFLGIRDLFGGKPM
jgi:hypothetical protein